MNPVKKLAKKRSVQIITILCIVIGIGVVSFVRWSNQPASTTIHIADDQAPAAAKAPAYQDFGSKLFKSEVPSGWAIRKNTDTATLSQVVSFPSGGSVNRGQIAVTVNALPAGGLEAVPDYNVRVQDRTNYRKQATNLAGVSATFLDRNGTTGYTAFMTRGSHYAVITVSQFATPEEAYALLTHVVEAWKWII